MHEVAERGQRRAALQLGHVGQEPGVLERRLDRVRRHVVLHDHNQHLVGTTPKEAFDHPQLLAERLGPELAERVAEVEPRLAVELAGADATRHPVGDAQRLGAEGLRHLVAIGALGAQIRSHAFSRRVEDPEVDVDQEAADAVVELAGDRVALIGEEPTRLGGRRERVVSGGEDHVAQAAVAEMREPVAAVARGQWRGGSGERDAHGRDGCGGDCHGGRSRRPARGPPPLRSAHREHPRHEAARGHGRTRQAQVPEERAPDVPDRRAFTASHP